MNNSLAKRGSTAGFLVGILLEIVNIISRGKMGLYSLYPFSVLFGDGSISCTGEFCWTVDILAGMLLGGIWIIIVTTLIGFIIGSFLKNK